MIKQTSGNDLRRRRASRLAGALGLLLALVLVAGVFMPAYAQDGDMPPAVPHFCAGTVSTSAGASVPWATWVEAWMEGVKTAETTVTNTCSYHVLVPGEYSDQGKIISFTAGNVCWSSGHYDVRQCDLIGKIGSGQRERSSGVQASQTAPWVSGETDDNFDLTISALPNGSPFPFPCFITTQVAHGTEAAYGTDAAEEVNLLGEFRDVVLLPSGLGTEFVSLYYEVSPPAAEVIRQHYFLGTAVKVGFIDPIVAILNWSHALWSEAD